MIKRLFQKELIFSLPEINFRNDPVQPPNIRLKSIAGEGSHRRIKTQSNICDGAFFAKIVNSC